MGRHPPETGHHAFRSDRCAAEWGLIVLSKLERIHLLWGSIFGALSLIGIVLVGYGAYALQRYLTEAAAAEQLAVVSSLKVGQIQAWMEHEKSTALGLSQGMLVSRPLEAWLDGGSLSEADRRRIVKSLKVIQGIFNYRDVGVLSVSGVPLLSSSGLTERVGKYDRWVLANAMLRNRPQITSVRWDEAAVVPTVHLDVLAPMVATLRGKAQVIAVLRLRVDPSRQLYPLVQAWPTASETAETLLVETQGADVVFLNELRMRPGLALRLQFPMSHPDLLAAQVARGGIDTLIEGRDYQGHVVLGTGRAIPGTQWHLVAKQDKAELFRDLWPRTLLTGLAALCFVGIAFLAVRLWLRQRMAGQVQAELEDLVAARTRQLQAALGKAQAADQAKSFLLARIGHELFTPLNHIQLYAQLVRDEWPVGEQPPPPDIDRILDSGRTLAGLIRQIIRYTDLEAGREQAVSQPFSPLALVRRLADECAPLAARKGLTFRSSFEPPLPETWEGDAERVTEILKELLENALKFTAHGGLTLRVRGGETLVFEVSDTGPGIPDAARSSIFLPLEQVDGSFTRGYGGTGIGLAIAHRLAELTGGRLTYDCPPEGGSCFRLSYPRSHGNMAESVS